jgi:hypothetical protein
LFHFENFANLWQVIYDFQDFHSLNEVLMSGYIETNLPVDRFPRRLIWLVLGDVAVFLLFVLIGRSNHSLSLSDVGALLSTAMPFAVGWFVVAPWFGLFRVEINRAWQQMLPRLLGAWLVLGGPLGLVLWAWLRGRAIPGGIIPTFAFVTIGIITAFLVIWRLAYSWWLQRQPH